MPCLFTLKAWKDILQHFKFVNSWFRFSDVTNRLNTDKKNSSPESKMAMTVPRPSYSGYLAKNDVAPVSIRGCNAQTGKSSILSAGFDIFPLSIWRVFWVSFVVSCHKSKQNLKSQVINTELSFFSDQNPSKFLFKSATTKFYKLHGL